MRTFTLNSPEFYRAVCEPRERPWIPNGALPREPRGGRRSDPVMVWAESDEEAEHALRSWLRSLQVGRREE